MLQKALNQGFICILETKGTNYPLHYILAIKQIEDDFLIFDSNSEKNKLSSFKTIYKITAFKRV